MKLMPDTALIPPRIAGAEGGKGTKPRLGAHTSGAPDFFLQLHDRSGTGVQIAPRSSRELHPVIAPDSMLAVAVSGRSAPHRSSDAGRAATDSDRTAVEVNSVRPSNTMRDLRPNIAADSTHAVALSGRLASHRSNDGGRAATDSDRTTVEANSVRPSKTIDTTRAASVVSDGRASSESIHVVSVDWPWLAIATGGLSYRPIASAAASTEIPQGSCSAAVSGAALRADAYVATPALESVEGKAGRGTSVSTILGLGTTPMSSPAGGSSEAREVDPTTWPLPAELRELLERRRLRLVEDEQGGLHLFARDFAMDEVQADQWAASLRQACQTMNQPLRALWINGRPYEIAQGERHDR